MTTHNVIIIGGGLSGLSTAYYLEKYAATNNIDLQYTLIEKAPAFGGKVVSEQTDGFVIEGAPDSFLTQKPWALELCKDLGLEDRLIGTNDNRRSVYILHRGQLCPFPAGWRLTAPTQLMSFLQTPLLSPWGKLRAALDLVIPPRKDQRDESLANFVTRRMGREVLEQLSAPIMAGIHIADPEKLSIQATFGRYPDMEKKYGSIIRGTLAQMKAARNRPASNLPMFISLKGGMGELISTLANHLNGDLKLGQAVIDLQRDAATDKPYRVQLSDGSTVEGDSIILTTPAYVAADLLNPIHTELADNLKAIRHISSATISLAYKRSDIEHPLDGFGFLVPKSEDSRLLACTWVSTKFDHRVPDDYVLLRAFVGGYEQEDDVDLPDDVLETLAREEFAKIMDIQAQPTHCFIYRWHKGTPQYDVGHLDRVAEMERMAAESLPGLYLTGCTFRGVGMPDCVHQSQQTAEYVIQYLKET